MSRLRSFRPSPALAISIVALVLAATGTATAAHYVITRSRQIKPGAVSGRNIARGTITLRNLASSTSSGLKPSLHVETTNGTVPAGGTQTIKSNCPTGQQATGGGYGNNPNVLVLESRPDPTVGTPRGWVVTAADVALPASNENVPVYAVCSS
jgi:hypothetical protein